MMHIDRKIEWCLRKGEEESKKHRGLRKVKPNTELSDAHIGKALHNLNLAVELQKGGKYTDWSISAAFYAMYHSVLALLWLVGYESRNQECSIVLLEKLIEDNKINMSKDDVKMLRQLEELAGEKDAKSLREEFQYGIETSAKKEILEDVIKSAKTFIGTSRTAAEEIKSKGVV